MRRRRSSRGDIVIDLTSLLDVIFIILLVVMCSQQLMKQEYQEQAQDAIETVQDAEAISELYKEQMELQDNLNEYVLKLSVFADFNPERVTLRTVRVLKEGQEIERYELIGANTAKAYENFEKSLVKYVEENSDKPVIFTLNEGDEKILYRDEKAILQIFEKLSDEYTNVYIR